MEKHNYNIKNNDKFIKDAYVNFVGKYLEPYGFLYEDYYFFRVRGESIQIFCVEETFKNPYYFDRMDMYVSFLPIAKFYRNGKIIVPQGFSHSCKHIIENEGESFIEIANKFKLVLADCETKVKKIKYR